MMAIATTVMWVTLLFLLAALVGGIFLQIFLSRRESRWPGLVLPLLTFLLSLLNVLNIADTGSVSENVLLVLVTVLIGNIPTLVLLAIYWAAREKRGTGAQREKMTFDDLKRGPTDRNRPPPRGRARLFSHGRGAGSSGSGRRGCGRRPQARCRRAWRPSLPPGARGPRRPAPRPGRRRRRRA